MLELPPLPEPGTALVVLEPGIDRYPNFLVRAGAIGILMRVHEGPPEWEVWVRMDDFIEGAQEWANEVQVWADSPENIRVEFWREFARVTG